MFRRKSEEAADQAEAKMQGDDESQRLVPRSAPGSITPFQANEASAIGLGGLTSRDLPPPVHMGIDPAVPGGDMSVLRTVIDHPATAMRSTVVALSGFFSAMAEKMHRKDAEPGLGDWYDKDAHPSPDWLPSLLVAQLTKEGSDPVDIANFCMMIDARGELAAMRAALAEAFAAVDRSRAAEYREMTKLIDKEKETGQAAQTALDNILDAINGYPIDRLPGEVGNFFDRLRDTIVKAKRAAEA